MRKIFLESGMKETFLCSGGKLSNIDIHGNWEDRNCTNEPRGLAAKSSRHSVDSATWPLPTPTLK